MNYVTGWYVEKGYSIYSSLLILTEHEGVLYGWWSMISEAEDFYRQHSNNELSLWSVMDEPEQCIFVLPEPYTITGGFYESP